MKVYTHPDKLAELCGGKGPLRRSDNIKPVAPGKRIAVGPNWVQVGDALAATVAAVIARQETDDE